MRQDLSDEQWDAVDKGVVVAPDGTAFHRRTTRMKRREATRLVRSGVAVLIYWPGGLPERTRLVWHEGPDARSVWDEVRSAVTSDSPRVDSATVGRWESAEYGCLLVVTWLHRGPFTVDVLPGRPGGMSSVRSGSRVG